MKATDGKTSEILNLTTATSNGGGKNELACRLDSWKEIASYLGRSTRCAQRWEKQLGLPVHRIRHVQGYTVYAYVAELDVWRQRRDQFVSREEIEAVPREISDTNPGSDRGARWSNPIFGLYRFFLKAVPVRLARS